MNLHDDQKKRMEFYEKHHHFLFYDKKSRGILSNLFLPGWIIIIVIIGTALLFYSGIKSAW